MLLVCYLFFETLSMNFPTVAQFLLWITMTLHQAESGAKVKYMS